MDAQVKLPVSGMEIRTTDTRYGPMQYYSGDGFIGRSLELYGEYSPGEIELFRKLVKPGWAIVNGGANIGALTVPLAELVPDGVVHAFEPHPEHFELLKANSKGRKNIKLHELALWHSRGDTKMRKLMEIESGNFGGTVLDNSGAHIIRMMALDDVLGEQHVDLLTLDIEGTETMALEGARKILQRDRPLLYLEDQCELDDNGQKCGDSTLVQYVRALDYVIFDHRPAMYSPDNWKNCPENAFLDIKPFGYVSHFTLSYNLLCVPSERLPEFRAVLDDPPLYYKGETGSKLLQIVVPKFPLNGTGWACIARMGGVGDNLMAASACRPLKELGYKVEVISQAPMAVVFQHNPYIDKLSIYEAGDWPTDLTQWQKWFVMRAKEYDRFANLSHSCEALCAAFTIQTAFWWPEKFRRKLFDRNYLESIHDILDLPHTFGPLFFPTAAEREQARITRQALKADLVIGWCLSGTRIDKIYPQSGQVVARLIKELGAHVVLMGAPPPHRDFQLAKEIMQIVEVTNGSSAGLSHAASPSLQEEKWPIRRILTFAATCDLYIGMDTGPSWGVAFEPIPKIILLSHASPTNITKHWRNAVTLHADAQRVSCWPCHRLHDDMSTCRPNKWNNGAACISDIDAETVIKTARQLLQRRTNGGP